MSQFLDHLADDVLPPLLDRFPKATAESRRRQAVPRPDCPRESILGDPMWYEIGFGWSTKPQ
jgi:hypothetical protein